MQEQEKTTLLIKLEELYIEIQEKPINQICLCIYKFQDILVNYSILKMEYEKRLKAIKEHIKNNKIILNKLYSIIQHIIKIGKCDSCLLDDKLSIEGKSTSLLYSDSINRICQNLLNNYNENLSNYKGILDFYYQILYLATGNLINKNIEIDRNLKFQNELDDIKNVFFNKIKQYADFKVLNYGFSCNDFIQNTDCTNKIYKIALSNVITELKKYIKNNKSIKYYDIKAIPQVNELTIEEQKFLNYWVQGYKLPTVAKALNKSQNTLKTQRNSIYNKLNVNNRDELIAKIHNKG